MNLDIFSNQIFLESIDYLSLQIIVVIVLVYANHGGNAKRFNARKYCLPKGIIKNCNVIINGKNFYDQTINSDIKKYEEIRKITTGQGKDYTTGCFQDYEYIKNHKISEN